jgi:hypothetical protein
MNVEHELLRAPSLPCYTGNARSASEHHRAPPASSVDDSEEVLSLTLTLSRLLRISLHSGPFLSRSERGNFITPPLRSASSFRSDEVIAMLVVNVLSMMQ